MDISVFAESLNNLSMAPLLLILSSSVLTNCLPDFIGYTSATNESLPTKTCACLTPLSTAGVSEKIVSVATGSCHLGTFNAGFLLFKCLFIGKESRATPHCVVWSIFCLTISELTHPKNGLNFS